MNKTLGTILATGALLVGGTTVDMVPVEAPLVLAVQWNANMTVPPVGKKATSTPVFPYPNFVDTNGDGKISAKIAYDKKGAPVFEQIDETVYANMGKTGGATLNTPVKYSVTLAEAVLYGITPVAEAAIAVSGVTDIWYFVGTSGTVAHTTSGTERVLYVAIDNEGGPDDFTGVTYNGVAMAEIGTRVQEGTTGRYSHTYALINPASGTNNIVISRSSSNQVNYAAVSYSGASQTVTHGEFTTSQRAAPIGTAATSLTTSVNNSWTVLFGRGARTQTASTGSTRRTPSASIHNLYDSNSAITPAGAYSMAYTQSPDNTAVCSQMWSVVPYVATTPASSPITPKVIWW
jgi:hypothetical protein